VKTYNLHTEQNGSRLRYRVLVDDRSQYIDATIDATIPLTVTLKLGESNISPTVVKQILDDLFLKVQQFEEDARKTTIYFAFVPGEQMVPQQEVTGWIVRLFTDSMLPLYLVLIVFTFLFSFTLNIYTPLLFIIISISLALLAGKFVAYSGNWKITQEQPEIHLLHYRLSPAKYQAFRRDHGQDIAQMRRDLYNDTLARSQTIDCLTAGQIFSRYGIHCSPDDFIVKTINLYHIVETAADAFAVPVPTIVVQNTSLPNAAAAGPTAQLGTILITTGLLTQLDEDELVNIIGHELSHLRAHDPLTMFAISTLEYLFRFYIIWPFLFTFGFFSYWLYTSLAFSLIYFIGKFLESRADLDSANAFGQPMVLAEALRKITFRQLTPLTANTSTSRGNRRAEWLRMDPHPPAYFRIQQLERLEPSELTSSTLLKAIKDNIQGFFDA
jgi:heat shock protein HtpX